jgi:hypothetical protein
LSASLPQDVGQVVLQLRERLEYVRVIVHLFVGVPDPLHALNRAAEMPADRPEG